MRKTLWLVLAVSLFPTVVWSDETIKIGVVDLQRVLDGSVAGKQAKEKFQAEVKRAEADLLKEKEQLERLQTDLEKKTRLADDEEKRDLERQFQQKYRNYVGAAEDSQAELRQREDEMTRRIFDDLRELIVGIGKKEGFTLILEKSRTLYFGAAIDITDKVIDVYDKRQNKSPGGAS